MPLALKIFWWTFLIFALIGAGSVGYFTFAGEWLDAGLSAFIFVVNVGCFVEVDEECRYLN